MNFRRPILLILIAVAFITPCFLIGQATKRRHIFTIVNPPTTPAPTMATDVITVAAQLDTANQVPIPAVPTHRTPAANFIAVSLPITTRVVTIINLHTTTNPATITSLAITINLPITTNQVTIPNPVILVLTIAPVTEILG